MSINQQLRNATFRKVPFLVKDSRILFGQKTVIHRYPNSSRVEVEYLGADVEEFSLDMIIKGTGDQYFSDRNALKIALLEGANGVLLHPYEGEINCAVVGKPVLNEQDREQGIASFIVNFIKVNEKIYPIETSNNFGLIQNWRDQVTSSLATWIDDSFNISNSYAYQVAKESFTTVSGLYTDVTNSIAVATNKISDVKSTIANFNNNTLSYLSGGLSTSGGLLTLYNSILGIGATPNAQFQLYVQLLDSILPNPTYKTSTAQRAAALKNTDIVNTSAKVQTLANIYNYTPDLEFSSIKEINAYRLDIEKIYQSIVNVDTSIPITSLSITGLENTDVAYNLSQLRSENQKYIDTIENIVGEIITINNVQPTTLENFVFARYGNLNNYDAIKALNNIQDPTQIRGTIQILSEVS